MSAVKHAYLLSTAKAVTYLNYQSCMNLQAYFPVAEMLGSL